MRRLPLPSKEGSNQAQDNMLVRPFPSRVYVLPSCTLRKLKRSEAQRLAAELVTMDPWRTLDYRAEAVALYLSHPDPTLSRFTIRSSGHTAGVLCLRYPWLRGVYLELLALFPPHQGLGLGREIMTWTEAEIRTRAKNFWIMVSSFNHRARRFYQDLGFAEVACLHNLIKEGHDELLLRKVLG
jgi:ribosomal protein S18 acetylase RimI-like enzyme